MKDFMNLKRRVIMRKMPLYIACILSVLALGGCAYHKPAGNALTDTGAVSEPARIDTAVESETAEKFTLPSSPLIEAVNPKQENMADMLQRASAGVMVRVVAQELSGSGVIYGICEDKLVIVTAGHILEQEKEAVGLCFFDDFAVESTEYVISENADLAFVKVPLSEIPVEHLEKYYCVNTDKEGFDALQSGAGVIAMGSKTEAAGDAYEGKMVEPWIYVEDFAQYMMLARVETYPGMSGGGLFDLQGHFLGILCGTDEEGEVAVVPLSILEAEVIKL